ncbi:HVO_0476 family zinc finger protein [Halocatena marina]|uniref:HVO_0476 family zinc finger protein n=1 Tax=Halocatena marina TaxID=2934937 RepID=A0ABD5YQF5_9EURY|nr:HVO_0476 family zinc finger protein [Halocatena marina]
MNEPTGHVPVSCPACSPDTPTVHEVLSPGGQTTVRCTECNHVHKTRIEEERTVERDVIVSQDGESFHTHVDAPASETIAVGEEFIVDTDEVLMTVRITDLELGEERKNRAPAEDVDTIWTRAVDNVSVSITINPLDGRHDDSRSIDALVPGDYEFTVGATEELGDEEFTVKSIKLREDAVGYDFDQLDLGGDSAVAKDIQRVYADDESSSAWSAW